MFGLSWVDSFVIFPFCPNANIDLLNLFCIYLPLKSYTGQTAYVVNKLLLNCCIGQ